MPHQRQARARFKSLFGWSCWTFLTNSIASAVATNGDNLTRSPSFQFRLISGGIALRSIIVLPSSVEQVRLSLFTQSHDAIPAPFLVILIFRPAIIFTSFGLFVRPNRIVTFFVGGLSVASAIFLILEMGQPFAGLMQISGEAAPRPCTAWSLTSASSPLLTQPQKGETWLMSAIGTKRTSPSAPHMSVFGGRADIA